MGKELTVIPQGWGQATR